MGKPRKKCIYCGKKADTKEHIPPKSFFVRRSGIKLITVPSCLSCNHSFSLDEEVFRNFLVHMCMKKSLTASALMDTKIKRSIIARPNMAKKAMEKMELVNYYHKGIYLGKKTAIKLEDSDWKRYFNVLSKIIKGLHFTEFKKIVPGDMKIEHVVGNNNLTQRLLPELKKLKWNTVNKDVFSYGYSGFDENLCSVWVTEFFKNIYFMSYVLNKNFDPSIYIKK